MFGDNYVVGTCYYPEHWDKSLWEEDLQRMLKAGITVIRMANLPGVKLSLPKEALTFRSLTNF